MPIFGQVGAPPRWSRVLVVPSGLYEYVVHMPCAINAIVGLLWSRVISDFDYWLHKFFVVILIIDYTNFSRVCESYDSEVHQERGKESKT